MSKYQILFSTKDPLGFSSNTDLNFENHCRNKNGDVLASDKLYPRGKAYWKLLEIQDSWAEEDFIIYSGDAS